MIKEVTYYTAECDRCGCTHDYDGITAWSDSNGALEMAEGSDWVMRDNGRLLCDMCRWDEDRQEEDDDD